MCTELCIGDTTDLVKGLKCNRSVWKGTDGAAVSPCCGKSIYNQGIFLEELSFTMDVQVEALRHEK
jgi:hypothetical protein